MPKIKDDQLTALITVLAANLNANPKLCRDFADTFSAPILPVQHIISYDISTGRAVIGGNTTLPGLGAWRMRSAYANQTNESRMCTATCGLKYILSANNDTTTMFAILARITNEIDLYLDGMVEDEIGGDILRAAGLTEWGVKWEVDFRYEGNDNQTLYPTATGRMMFKHDSVFDSSKLQQMLSMFLYYNLKGVGKDGDLAPVFNPLVSQCLPPDAG